MEREVFVAGEPGMARWLVRSAVFVLGSIAVGATLLPLVRTDLWWIRTLDYPKWQVLVVCAGALVLWCLVARPLRNWRLVPALALAACCAYHAWRIAPFTPLWPLQVAEVEADDDLRCVSVLFANVLMENGDKQAVADLIRDRRPDVVLLLETDAAWVSALEDLTAEFETALLQPQQDHYGLMFLTNLKAREAAIRTVVEPRIPSVRAELTLRSGDRFMFYGLHPEPPVMGNDTDERDAELVLVARDVKRDAMPAIVGGDLNDVAWSHTTRLFKRISGLLDPRVGRGLYATFPVGKPWFAWPLDHLFHTNDFQLDRLEVLESVGSDHYPVFARICLTADSHAENARPEDREGDDGREAEAIVEDGTDGE